MGKNGGHFRNQHPKLHKTQRKLLLYFSKLQFCRPVLFKSGEVAFLFSKPIFTKFFSTRHVKFYFIQDFIFEYTYSFSSWLKLYLYGSDSFGAMLSSKDINFKTFKILNNLIKPLAF
jgi:hypothetical protein